MRPSYVDPDMSSLKLIKESEVERGRVIGSGAFGTVYEVRFTIHSQLMAPLSVTRQCSI